MYSWIVWEDFSGQNNSLLTSYINELSLEKMEIYFAMVIKIYLGK